MRYRVLACDYDGTIATDGRVDAITVAALARFRESGRKLLLVTGRELDELLGILAEIWLFDWVVAENGALLYRPETKQTKLLGPSPSAAFADALKEQGVGPISVGRVIVATWEPHETTVLKTIRDMGLELQVIFNKGAVMILPTGLTKATGLVMALRELGLTVHEAVGVGDAENDHSFLSICECSAAVANALPAVKGRADVVTHRDHGAGVTELIDRILRDDLADVAHKLVRHDLLLGFRDDGSEVRLPAFGPSAAIIGPGGSGKTIVVGRFLEALLARHYQFCILDPAGNRDGMKGTTTVGSNQAQPSLDDVLQLLADDRHNAVVNLVAVPTTERPNFVASLLSRLQEMRAGAGRPHWVVIEEASQLLPEPAEPGHGFPGAINRTLLVSSHVEQVAKRALSTVGSVLALGADAESSLGLFCKAVGEKAPVMYEILQPGLGLLWDRQGDHPPMRLRIHA